MPASPHEFFRDVTDEDLDLFGHVNNAAYLKMYEEARWDLITGNGFGVKEIRERQIGPTILEVRLRFKKEVLGRQRVLIRSRTTEYKSKLGRIEQVMLRADGEIASTAEFVFGLFDLKARKLLRPTPEWLRAVGVVP